MASDLGSSSGAFGYSDNGTHRHNWVCRAGTRLELAAFGPFEPFEPFEASVQLAVAVAGLVDAFAASAVEVAFAD